MISILQLDHDGILALDPRDVTRIITVAEVEHMAKQLGALWLYDYVALKAGKPGMHAILKSGYHSDGFFVSRIFFTPSNVLDIMSWQMIMKLNELHLPTPDYLAGIPDGATGLGKAMGRQMGVEVLEMKKDETGKIKLITQPLGRAPRILPVEDFCTRGTGLIEGVLDIYTQAPHAEIMQYDPVILNRGGLTEVEVPGLGVFKIVPVVERRVQDWPAESCALCAQGSTPIKPKATDENWRLINNSQL